MEPQSRSHEKWRLRYVSFLLFAIATAMLIVLPLVYVLFFRVRLGPAQPIAFSHKFHSTSKQISCLMCHPGAIDSSRAQIPPLQRCMLCHEHIAIHHPQIASLRQHYFDNRPVPWVRVSDLPDYVYFEHDMHTQVAGFDCGRCHGDVAAMDRIEQVHKFSMGFCIQCHRDYQASTDCLICHR